MIQAYFDESGQRGSSAKASPTFVMGGVMLRDRNALKAHQLLENLRTDLGRQSGQHLHYNKIRSHSQRLRLAQELSGQPWLRGMCVVACKEHLPRRDLDDDQVYLYQLRMLLERLSWFARDMNEKASFTIGHVKNFKVEKLSEYETKLRGANTRIDWNWLDPSGGKINQPQRLEQLQLADIYVSSVASAFNPDEFGNVETRYLREISKSFYRPEKASLTSYGLKMHPWNKETQEAYSWVSDL